MAVESGARTQLANAICATLIIISLFTMTDALYYIPNATLGSIIFVSILNMLDYERIIKLYKAGEKLQAVVTLVTMLCVILLGVTQGLVLGVFCSYAAHLYRDSLPRVYPLGISTLVGRDGTAFIHFTELSHSSWTDAGMDADVASVAAERKEKALDGDAPPAAGLVRALSSGSSWSDGPSPLKQGKDQGQRQDVPKAVPGMIIARIDSDSIYFGNAGHINRQLEGMAQTWRSSYLHDPVSTSVFSEVSCHTMQRPSSKAKKVLIVDISSAMHIDERSVITFTELKKKMAKNNVIMAFAHCGWPDDLATEQEWVVGQKNLSSPQQERLARHLLIHKQLEAAGFATTPSVNNKRQAAAAAAAAGKDTKAAAAKAGKGQTSGVTLFSSLERAVRYFSVSMFVDCVHLSMEYADNISGGEEDGEGERQKESPLAKKLRLEREREQSKEAEAEAKVTYDEGQDERPSSFSGRLSDTVREIISGMTLDLVNPESPGREHGQGQPEVESPIHQHGAKVNDSLDGGVKIE